MIMVGDILKGFCGGHFGRDSYEDKRVEGVGTDWVVARGKDTGIIQFGEGVNIHEECIKKPDFGE